MYEFNIINKYFYPLTNKSFESQGLSDDVAILKEQNLVVSSDLMIENIHFNIKDGAFNIANRLLRSNLSDIAASGAMPLYYLLNFSKNDKVNEEFIQEFTQALAENNNQFKIYLIGGDTSNSKQDLFFNITIFGQRSSYILSRNNAQDRDLIFTSGNIGDAFLGRLITQGELKSDEKEAKYLVNRYYNPEPRINLGLELVRKELSKSAIDISDGLFADLNHICQSSNLKANIFYDKIPVSIEARNILNNNSNISYLDLFSGGDDYELIFSVKEKDVAKIDLLSKNLGVKLTNIGYLEKNNIKTANNIKLFKNNKKLEIKKLGYEH